MLRSVKNLDGLSIGATDGPIGTVKDFYFDDEAWVVRYVVADTSAWFGHQVLISPYSLGKPDWSGNSLPVTISKQQVKNSPSIDTDKPVSRQYESSYLGYYGYPYYWGGMGLWGAGYYPGTLRYGTGGDSYSGYQGHLRAPSDADSGADTHLRSCSAVKGYHIRASDGEIGHVQDFLVDDSTWSIRYLIVNTSNWWVGHQVLVSPEWIKDVDWLESVVTVGLNRESVKQSPPYESDIEFGRASEDALYGYYGRARYWQNPFARAVA